MFFSIMGIFHERMPCSSNFFTLKRLFDKKITPNKYQNQSLTKNIVSPSMFKNVKIVPFTPVAAQNNYFTPFKMGCKRRILFPRNSFVASNDQKM